MQMNRISAVALFSYADDDRTIQLVAEPSGNKEVL
jgi:hypothetical protein